MADQAGWYVRKGGKEHGPFTSPQLKKLATESQINPDTEVRQGENGNWRSAKRVNGLFDPVAPPQVPVAAPPPPPVVPQGQAVVIVQQQLPEKLCPYCGEVITMQAVKCRHCGEFLDGRPTEQPQQPQQVIVQQNMAVHVPVKRWSPVVAMLLSFLIPGLGQLYKGQVINGIGWFIVTLVGYLVFFVPGLLSHLFCIIGAGMGDPYR